MKDNKDDKMFESVILNIIIAFTSMFVVDIVNAIYIRHIQNDNALQSAVTSGFVFLIYSIAVITYVDNNLYLIPACLGAVAGTFSGVKINKKFIKSNS
jgi:hypothetical protein